MSPKRMATVALIALLAIFIAMRIPQVRELLGLPAPVVT